MSIKYIDIIYIENNTTYLFPPDANAPRVRRLLLLLIVSS